MDASGLTISPVSPLHLSTTERSTLHIVPDLACSALITTPLPRQRGRLEEGKQFAMHDNQASTASAAGRPFRYSFRCLGGRRITVLGMDPIYYSKWTRLPGWHDAYRRPHVPRPSVGRPLCWSRFSSAGFLSASAGTFALGTAEGK